MSHAGIFAEKLRASLLAKQFFGKYSHRAKPVSEMPHSGFELCMAAPRVDDSLIQLRASLLTEHSFCKYSHRAKPVSEMPHSGFELCMAPSAWTTL